MVDYIYKKYELNIYYVYKKIESSYGEIYSFIFRNGEDYANYFEEYDPNDLSKPLREVYVSNSRGTFPPGKYYSVDEDKYDHYIRAIRKSYQGMTTNKAYRKLMFPGGAENIYGEIKSDSYGYRDMRYNRGSYIGEVTAPDGTYPNNGRSGSYWYVRDRIANNAPTTPGYINVPQLSSGKQATITWGKSTDSDGDSIRYQLQRKVDSGSYTTLSSSITATNYTDNIEKSWNKVTYRVRAYDGKEYSSYRTSNETTVTHNVPPIINITTTDNRTLYEGDTISLTGNVKDEDSGNVITLRYSINNGTERAILSEISKGTSVPFNKTLTFKSGKLYDGSTAVTGDLSEGTQNFIKLWASDDQGGRSEDKTINFYVVPNRPPKLTINKFTPTSGMINTDKITLSGNAINPDENGVTVEYKIGNNAYKQVYTNSGRGGDFEFQITLSELNVGKNNVTIKSTDYHGATDTKVIEITKDENKKPLKTAVARYRLTPPNGTAKGIVLWIERETGDLEVDVKIHMGNSGEVENFKPMTKNSTAFVRDGIEEDEFTFEADTAKENIIIEITMTRSSTTSNKGITLISGVLS